jgi:formylglycine-generating enzyme required for sulfatase activity
MGGARSVVVVSAVMLAVLPYTGQQQPRLKLDMVQTESGLMVMRHEVTTATWRRCYEGGGCSFLPTSRGKVGETASPVTGIGILDAEEFVAWARKAAGRRVRLPTLHEWQELSGLKPQNTPIMFADPRLDWAAAYGGERKTDPKLRPKGGFGTNTQGVADVKGSVWEWTSTCVVERAGARCPAYFAAGEHAAKVSIFVRDPQFGGCSSGTPPTHLGLRLVADPEQGSTW